MTPFHRRGHGAGVNHIIAKIWPGIDAGDHNIRPRAHQRIYAQKHAVGRRPHLDGNIAILKGKGAK